MSYIFAGCPTFWGPRPLLWEWHLVILGLPPLDGANRLHRVRNYGKGFWRGNWGQHTVGASWPYLVLRLYHHSPCSPPLQGHRNLVPLWSHAHALVSRACATMPPVSCVENAAMFTSPLSVTTCPCSKPRLVFSPPFEQSQLWITLNISTKYAVGTCCTCSPWYTNTIQVSTTTFLNIEI